VASTSAITVIIVPEMPIRRVRASSEVPWKSSGAIQESGPMSIVLSSEPQSRATTTALAGSTHKAPLR
jgi:hypothetical protein